MWIASTGKTGLLSSCTAVVINHKWCNHPLGETMRHMLPWLNDKRKLCLVTLLWEPKGKKGNVSDPATPHGGSVGQNSRSIDIRKTISGPIKYSFFLLSNITPNTTWHISILYDHFHNMQHCRGHRFKHSQRFSKKLLITYLRVLPKSTGLTVPPGFLQPIRYFEVAPWRG